MTALASAMPVASGPGSPSRRRDASEAHTPQEEKVPTMNAVAIVTNN
jgi:hypothetical protein